MNLSQSQIKAQVWARIQTINKRNMNRSLTIIGLIVSLVGTLVNTFHIPLPYTMDEIEKALTVIATLLGIVIAWIGRYRHGDITLFGKKLRMLQPQDSHAEPNDSL